MTAARKATRAVLALLVGLLVVLFAPTTSADAVPPNVVEVRAYAYDDFAVPGQSDADVTERGPPAAAYYYAASTSAVDPGSPGASARPHPGSIWSYTTYDPAARSAQFDSAGVTTQTASGCRVTVVCVVSIVRCAAKTGVRTCLNSFTGTTLVLMADGSKKPIKDVKLGDRVMATDPETGESGSRKVVDLIRHGGWHTMVAVSLSDGSAIDATDRHPFWVESRGEWVDAIDLQPGDVVVTADGDRLTVASLGISEQDLTAYNLTVEGLHTYFVGAEDVLVHNAACPTGLRGASDGLTGVFGGGSVRGRSIADIRSGLLDDGFTQGLANNKKRYLFTNSAGEQGRIMSRGGGWDIRIRNSAGNYLDEFGNVATPGSTHSIEVFSR